MEKYKIKSLSKWWYVVLAGLTLWYVSTKMSIAAILLFLFVVAFICILLIRQLQQFFANVKIKIATNKLNKVHTLSELSEAICSFPKAKSSLKTYLLNMALEKMTQMNLTAMKVNHIIANGRPCYLMGYGLQVVKRKRNNEVYFDFSTAKKITYFVFPNNLEWLTADTHQAIPINNIIKMELDIDNDILAVMKRGQGIIYFCGKDIIVLKTIINSLQSKRIQSW